MMDHLEQQGFGQRVTTYRLRDWLISRQRYWGAPIPIVYDPEGKPHPVKDEHLPWILPTDVEFKPTGESPLHHSQELKDRVEQLYGQGWTPEYDTMDTFVDSSWYFLRYVDSRNSAEFAAPDKLAKWLPVDFYMIGPEHIVLHLLYSRFFTKFLRDEGYLNFDEPFMKMRHQGMILGPDGKKMSKSKGNVINPDDIVEKFGADTLRVYEMFMGPIEADKPWDVSAVAGVYRFLSRVHKLVSQAIDQPEGASSDPEVERKLHQTIKKVTQDIADSKFNTAIAAMMELINVWEARAKQAGVDSGQVGFGLSRADTILFVQLTAPFAPFLAEELYQQLAGPDQVSSVHLSSWPAWDQAKATQDELVIPVQINGKVRGQLTIPSDQAQDEAAVLAQAHQLEIIQKWLEGQSVAKKIYVPGRIINLVTQ
jgi:leucyl-tRNA synthetase